MRIDELATLVNELKRLRPKIVGDADCSVIADINAGYHQGLDDLMRAAILARSHNNITDE